MPNQICVQPITDSCSLSQPSKRGLAQRLPCLSAAGALLTHHIAIITKSVCNSPTCAPAACANTASPSERDRERESASSPANSESVGLHTLALWRQIFCHLAITGHSGSTQDSGVHPRMRNFLTCPVSPELAPHPCACRTRTHAHGMLLYARRPPTLRDQVGR
jgi:hypothetical protein